MRRARAADAARHNNRATALVAALSALAVLPASAQWPLYEDKHAPPRTADGRLDFSGLWELVGPGRANASFEARQSPDGGPPAATF